MWDPFADEGVVESTGDEDGVLEIGLVSSTEADIDTRLQTFASTFERVVQEVVDGRKTRHMKFEWTPPTLGRTRLGELQKPEQEGVEVRFETAVLHPELIIGAEVLSSRVVRETLQELSQAGFARERDILTRPRRSVKQEEVRIAIDDLKRSGLVITEHLLTCRKSGNPLTRLTDTAKLRHRQEITGSVERSLGRIV